VAKRKAAKTIGCQEEHILPLRLPSKVPAAEEMSLNIAKCARRLAAGRRGWYRCVMMKTVAKYEMTQ
jgi:hypothetical protein